MHSDRQTVNSPTRRLAATPYRPASPEKHLRLHRCLLYSVMRIWKRRTVSDALRSANRQLAHATACSNAVSSRITRETSSAASVSTVLGNANMETEDSF